ncbi:EamA family transporter [Natronococcus wangiae]|uniref:EamA family transporter n=1 Tax=Natronococcus wangiae TaxID=3068275 RepID=UPI00273D924C|nr:EamA family transporter [Natronococcus sp. AD5]
MIATWLVYALLTATIYAGIALLSKVVSGASIDDPAALTIYTCAPFYAVYVAAGPLLEWSAITGGEAPLPTGAVLAAIAFGVVSTVGYAIYYWGVVVGDVSRFVPVLAIETIFVLVLGVLLLGESFPTGVYAGIALVVSGALFISVERDGGSVGSRVGPPLVAVALLAAAAFAVLNTGMKALTTAFGTVELLFWISLGGLLSLGAAVPFRTGGRFRPRLDADVATDLPVGSPGETKLPPGTAVLLAAGLLNALALFTFIRALEHGPVSLATAITKVDVMLVFVGALSLSKLAPELLNEQFDRFTLLQKGFASSIILVGCVLIQLGY